METIDFLSQTVTILAVAVVVVAISYRLRMPPVVGFLLSGMLIGPSGLALVADPAQVEVFAEVGVALLLFVIGLQLKPSEMKDLGRSFLVGGTLQWLLTTGLTVAVVMPLGLSLANAIFIGFVVSLSSTAVVLKEYQERRETTTPQGRVVLGVLLFQDLLIVPMIALTPILAGSISASVSGLVLRFGGGLVAVAIVFFLSRVVIARLTRLVAETRIRELFVLGSLTLCLAMAWFTARLDFSFALGAFLAGLLVAETDYSHQVTADIGPFRDVFASIFFVSIGMLVDVPFALSRLPVLIGLTAALVLGKALMATMALKLAGFATRVAVICGISISQIGEFSFVLMEVGREHGLLQGGRFQVLLLAAVLTVALTPLLIRKAPALGVGVTAKRESPQLRQEEAESSAPAGGHVIVGGYGMGGRLLTRVLGVTQIPSLVVELDPDTVQRARQEGARVLFGDVATREILERAGIGQARIVVFAISDFATVLRSIRTARELSPGIEIVVRTRRFSEIDALRQAGADQVVAEEFESAIEIFTQVLEAYHVPRNIIRAETRLLRGESYRMLRSAPLGEVPQAVLAALEAGTTDIYRIAPGGVAAGRTLRDLDLRRRTGSSVIAVVRGEKSQANPEADVKLEVGDCLVLVGSHEEVDDAFQFLDGGE